MQKRYTKKVCKLLNLKFNNYNDRLKIMGLESLEYRRLKFDLILLYKIFNKIIYVDFDKFFARKDLTSKYNLRRHQLYLEKFPKAKTAIRENFFSFRIVNVWNSLPESVVKSISLPSFKLNLNKINLYNHYKFVLK